MNSRQENVMSMYDTIDELFSVNSIELQNYPALWSAIESFRLRKQLCNQLIILQKHKSKGATTDKMVTKNKLVLIAEMCAGAIFAYASSIEDNDLAQSFNFPKTSLSKLRDQDFIPSCELILNKTLEIQAQIAPYGIDVNDTNRFQELFAKIQIVTPKPRIIISEGKSYTAELNEAISATSAILRNLIDKAMLAFKVDNPDLYLKYKNMRNIVDNASGRRKEIIELPEESFIMGSITDTEGNPIEDALITLKPRDVKMQEITLEVAADSEYYIESVPLGFWDMVVSKEGYLDTRIENFEVTKDDELSMDITLEAIADGDDNEEDT